ncbi:MAG: MFS transporter, partial [Thermoplasmata archaeon]|nr:MFS transporter [Thermoplasmata archaeon]
VKTVKDVVTNIKIAFKDKKFVVMVILIGGFWALYSSFLNVLPLVLIGFKLVPFWFTAMVLGIFNPLTIILAGPFLAKFGEKIESIKLLIGGVFVYCIGLTIIGLTLQWVMVIVGIVFASIGEFMVAPGYLAFVSKLAPKEKVSSYIGCNFLATSLGITLGTLVFGTTAGFIAFDMEMPNFMYGILVSFGLGLLVAFIIYYRSWGQDIIARAKKIREEEEGIDEEETITFHEPFLFKIFDHKLATIIPLIFIPIILISTFSLGTKTFYGIDDDEEEPPIIDWGEYDETEYQYIEQGALNENTQDERVVLISERNVNSVSFTLTWTDEGDSDFRHENQPDEFTLSVKPANGTTQTSPPTPNPQGGTGAITVEFDFFENQRQEYYNGTGEYQVSIQLGTCGDQELLWPSPGFRDQLDTSNAWELDIKYSYFEKPE